MTSVFLVLLRSLGFVQKFLLCEFQLCVMALNHNRNVSIYLHCYMFAWLCTSVSFYFTFYLSIFFVLQVDPVRRLLKPLTVRRNVTPGRIFRTLRDAENQGGHQLGYKMKAMHYLISVAYKSLGLRQLNKIDEAYNSLRSVIQDRHLDELRARKCHPWNRCNPLLPNIKKKKNLYFIRTFQRFWRGNPGSRHAA